jgi:uncharacterized protein VirK/YbjX
VELIIVDDLKWLWKMSAAVCAHENPRAQKRGFGAVRILNRRLSYVAKSARVINSLQVYMHPREGSPLQRIMRQRPALVGATIWPYICLSWSAETRLQRIEEHFGVIEKLGSQLDFPVTEMLSLIDLADVATNLRVVLDQPKWFMREGLFVINLFIQDVRIYSLAFSFAFEEGEIVTHIGAIQGVDVEGILGDYKDLTKALHGMRPRDFLVELFRIFCCCLGVSKIYAVNDAKRQHRSSYFGSQKSEELLLNYNDIWVERGGVQDSEDFFALSVETPMRNLEEVPSKKRAMYRRRYELLQSIEARMQSALKVNAKEAEATDMNIVQQSPVLE